MICVGHVEAEILQYVAVSRTITLVHFIWIVSYSMVYNLLAITASMFMYWLYRFMYNNYACHVYTEQKRAIQTKMFP